MLRHCSLALTVLLVFSCSDNSTPGVLTGRWEAHFAIPSGNTVDLSIHQAGSTGTGSVDNYWGPSGHDVGSLSGRYEGGTLSATFAYPTDTVQFTGRLQGADTLRGDTSPAGALEYIFVRQRQ